MASPLRTVVLRLPCQGVAGRTVGGLVRSSPKVSFSTATPARPVCLARPTLRQSPISAAVPKNAFRANSTSASSSSTGEVAALDWNTFFKLRLKRRRIQVVFSLTTGLIGGAAGAIALSMGLAEPVVAQVPLDPFATLGLITLACVGAGWLIGPSIGNQVFYILNRRFKKQMTEKEAQFFARIKKHRIDPSNSSASNPVPDFYGEKIQSVSGYRQWLKDQKAFNKKKTANFV